MERGLGWRPGESNFQTIKAWNKADVYARTIALFADRLDGKPPTDKRVQK